MLSAPFANITNSNTRVINAAFLCAPETADYVFNHGRRRQIAQRASVFPDVICADCLDAKIDQLSDTEVIFGSWGMPALLHQQLDQLPKLRAVFYAAGTVQYFARPFLERGILLTSAWRANGIPAAEFTLAQILLSCKGYWRNVQEYNGTIESYSGAPQTAQSAFRGPGNYDETIALLGCGVVGRALIELLRPFHLHILVFDPFLDPIEAIQMGVEKVEMPEAFERGYVVSNHLADKPETVGLITGSLLARMRRGSTFINTGRGRTVNELEMISALRTRPDMTALLDVTDPEPMGPNPALLSLPNARVSAHIAGSIGNEVVRMADEAIAEFDRYMRGEKPRNAVTLDMLATMA